MTVTSTTSQPETGTVLGRQKDGTRLTVPCPLLIDYNQFMGGVDRGDQVRGYYSCRTKCRKFCKYIFHFVFNLPSRMCTSSRRATVAVHHSQQSKPSGCSWQVSSLVTIVVDEELVMVLSVLSLFATILQQSQRKIPARRPSTIEPNVTGAIVEAKGVSTPPECQLWLCHTGERHTDCFMLWHAQHLPEDD